MLNCIEFKTRKRSDAVKGKALFLAVILAETNRIESLLKEEQKAWVQNFFKGNNHSQDKILSYKSQLNILKAIPKLVKELM